MSGLVVRGDALRLPLRDASVDLIVTSPPYFALRSYRDGGEHYSGQVGSEATPEAFLRALWAALDECWRVLKPTGSCWVNLGDKYAGSGGHNNSGISSASTLRGNGHVGGVGKAGPTKIKATLRSAPDRYNQSADVLPKSVMGLPWRFALGASCPDPYRTCYQPGDHPQWINRRPHIWHKPNGLPESVTDRSRANYEDWFHLTKQGAYYASLEELREPNLAKPGQSDPTVENLSGNGVTHRTFARNPDLFNPAGKKPGSVWTIPTDPLILSDEIRSHYDLPDHFAAFPQEFPRRIILGWSPPDAVVLDPFSGTGTVVGVARALGRRGVGVDLSGDYCRLAQWFLRDGRRYAKAASRTDAERQGALL